MEVLIEISGEKKVLAFDEIQNIKGWELFVNRLLRQGYHVYITGSNANLLSKELGTYLTGRHADIELYPFSFSEFLRARKINYSGNGVYSTDENAMFRRCLRSISILEECQKQLYFEPCGADADTQGHNPEGYRYSL